MNASQAPIKSQIAAALWDAIKEAGEPTPPHLLGILNSWGDTLDDDEVLEMLEAWSRS